MRQIRLIALAGSLRAGSLNRKLLHVATRIAADAGAEVDVVEPADLAMPPYDGDLEAAHGLPPAALALKQRIERADALLVSTPEYNGSIPGMFKNVVDWLSRPTTASLRGKIAAVMSASPGAFGGMRSQRELRWILSTVFTMWVIPGQLILPRAHEAFDEGGALKDEKTQQSVAALVRQLLDTVPRFIDLAGA